MWRGAHNDFFPSQYELELKVMLINHQVFKSPQRTRHLTRVPQLAVPEHRDDDQQIPQHVHHRGEDQHAGQDSYDPGGAGAPLRGQCAL